MNPTAVKVRALAATGEYESMQAVAHAVGVTRERVRQIIRAENIPWNDFAVRLEWDCPGCGTPISLPRSTWEEEWRHMPAHCRECAGKQKAEFCKRDHPRSSNMNSWGQCRACANTLIRCVVERRSCVDCGKELPITRGMMNQIKMGNATGKRCRSCNVRRAANSTHKKPYCKWGHARTPGNLYRGGACKACMRRRTREWQARKTSGGASA